MPALRLRLRTTCVTCGHPIPMTAAALAVACPTCDAPKALAASDLAWIVGGRPREGMAKSVEGGEDAVILGEVESAPVTCGACGASIDDPAVGQAMVRGGMRCRCGRAIAVRPVPSQLDPERWWTALVGESAPTRPNGATAPVSFACPSCGGGLMVDGTTRTPECRHCRTRAYLPDDLWRALRPTPKAETFFLWIDPAWYADWSRQTTRQTRLILLTMALVILGIAVAAGLAMSPLGLTDSNTGERLPWYWGAAMSLTVSWFVAVAAGLGVGHLARPRRPGS